MCADFSSRELEHGRDGEVRSVNLVWLKVYQSWFVCLEAPEAELLLPYSGMLREHSSFQSLEHLVNYRLLQILPWETLWEFLSTCHILCTVKAIDGRKKRGWREFGPQVPSYRWYALALRVTTLIIGCKFQNSKKNLQMFSSQWNDNCLRW